MASATSSTLRPNLLPDIELLCPATRADLISHLRNGAALLAGGTDMVLWASQSGKPDCLAWTGGVEEFRQVEIKADIVRIGAAVTLSELVRSPDFRSAVTAVADGAQCVGSVQLRNQATMVGNLCTASPAGDTIPGLVVHDSVVEVESTSGERREIGIESFLVGPGMTALDDDELVTAVRLSPLQKNEASCFRRFTQREALDLAFASVAARVLFAADRTTIRSASLALGAVDKTVVKAPTAAAALEGRSISSAALEECADAAAECCSPISDHRASADYRRQLIRSLVHDVLSEVARRVNFDSGESRK